MYYYGCSQQKVSLGMERTAVVAATKTSLLYMEDCSHTVEQTHCHETVALSGFNLLGGG